MAADPKDDLAKLRADLDEALRFLHTMGMQTKAIVRDTTMKVTGLISELLDSNVVDKARLTEQVLAFGKVATEADNQLYHVKIADPIDKYAQVSPDIPCAELIPLCGARCCSLTVFLSFQDLDERVLQWDYGAPYMLRKGPDGYCGHCTPETKACTVYHHRPTVCRTYDCRKDKRIWIDYERRIPAPPEAAKEPPEGK